MNTEKEMDLVRRRNAELSKTVDELKDKIEFDEQYNRESLKYAKDLIAELEGIRAEWTEELNEIKRRSDEYERLIGEVRKLRSVMQNAAKRMNIPWYQRIKLFRKQEE